MAREFNVKNFYLYLVCLVTLFLLVGGAIAAVNTAMNLALPDQPNVPLINVYYPEYRDNLNESEFNPPSLGELEKRRQEIEEMEISYRGYLWRSLLGSIALVIISTPFYYYHWRKIKPGMAEGGQG